MNLRVGKRINLVGRSSIELFGEVFNLFNAKNPTHFSSASSSPLTTAARVNTGTASSNAPNPAFMKPLGYAGDALQAEQRVGQIGFRFSSKAQREVKRAGRQSPGLFLYVRVRRATCDVRLRATCYVLRATCTALLATCYVRCATCHVPTGYCQATS